MSQRTSGVPRRPPLADTRQLARGVWIALAALITSLILFGGYYYWDRYVHLGDKSPLDIDIQTLEKAIRDDPTKPEPRLALAEYYLGKGMYQEALKQSTQVSQAFPDNDRASLVSGMAYVRLNQPEAAEAPLKKFVAMHKDQEMANMDTALEAAYYFLGESYVKLKRPADAVAALEAALVITPTDADALYQAGLAYQAAGQPRTAVERYEKAVRLVPDFAEAYAGMIDSYSALDLPDYAAYARGMQAFSLKDYKTAQTQLEQATQTLPDFAPAFLGLGLTYEKKGNLNAALPAVQQALKLNPDDFAAQQALGRIQAALGAQG